MKSLLTGILMLLSVMVAQAQQVVHTVQRGETLESIAAKYHVTKEAITKNNPYASDAFYVGLKLYIPIKQSDKAVNNGTQNSKDHQTEKSSMYPESTNSNHIVGSLRRFELEAFAGLSLNTNVGDDIDAKMKIGGHGGITGRYFFVNDFFGEVSLSFATKGYKMNNNNTSGSVWIDDGANYDSELQTTMTTYNLEMPINIGYAYNISEDVRLRIKVGPYVTYAISGESKVTGYNTYYPDIHSSETEHINKTTKLSDISSYEKFCVGIQGGVGVEYGNFSLSATYQRGLTKLYENGKIYEQNVLITLGYKIAIY